MKKMIMKDIGADNKCMTDEWLTDKLTLSNLYAVEL